MGTDTLPKKIYRWQISIWQDAPYPMSSGKCKLKQWDTISQLLEWPKSRTRTPPHAVRTGSHRNSHSLLEGMQNGAATLEDSLSSYRTKYALTIWSSSHSPCYLSRRAEKLCPHKNLPKDVHSRFIHNRKPWKQPGCPSTGEWINKL